MKGGIQRAKFWLSNRTSFWFLLGFGLMVRLMYAAFLYPNWLPGDAYFYHQEALNLLDGKGLEFYWPPGLIFLLLPFAKLSFGSVLFSLLVWLGFVFAWEKLGRNCLDEWKKNLGHLIFAIFPAFIHQSVIPLSHLPLAAALIWIIYLLHTKSSSLLVLATLLFSMGGLIRPGFWALLPLFLLFLYQKKIPATHWALVGLSLFLLPMAWELYGHQETGRWIRINDANAYNLYLGNHPQTHPYRSWWLGSHEVDGMEEFASFQAERDSIRLLSLVVQTDLYQQKAWTYIRSQPLTFLQRMGSRFRNFWAFDTLASGTLIRQNRRMAYLFLILDALIYFTLLSLGLMYVFQEGKIRFWLMGILLLYLLPYLLAFAHPTYHLPSLPILCLMALKNNSLPSGKKLPLYLIIFAFFLFVQVEWSLDLWERYGENV